MRSTVVGAGRKCVSDHPDLAIAVLDLNFIEIVVAQQLCEFTHEGCVDAHRSALVSTALAGLGHSKSPDHARSGRFAPRLTAYGGRVQYKTSLLAFALNAPASYLRHQVQ